MSVLSVIIALGLVGVVLWIVNTYVPMEAGIKKLLNVVVIVILCVWLLQSFGLLQPLSQIKP